ncbi:MAG: hypothetical protein RMJ98_14410 [Myxococcales bacterium]|nr:hypothetical protein [Polyangiaceae bacterium]MDW8250485.1 hypothetical protein [Myxococcales bacterium]
MRWREVIPLTFLLLTSPALADPPPAPIRHVEVKEPPRTEGDDVISSYTAKPFLSIHALPLRLLGGVGVLGAEVRILDKLTAIGRVGYGKVTTLDPVSAAPRRQPYFELEVQARYYPIGNMQGGLYSGVGFIHAVVDTDQLITAPFLNLSSGSHVGPNLGGNYAFPFGLLVDVQLVLPFRLYRPEPTVPSPEGFDRAGSLRTGFNVALGYLF